MELQALRPTAMLTAMSARRVKKGAIAPLFNLFTEARSYLTASFSALPETNAGTLAAAILISLPVCGLRPVRSLRWFTLKVPKPTNCTASPSFRDSVIAAGWIQSQFSLCFGKVSLVRDYINQLSLVHKLSLQCVYRLQSIECDGYAD